MMTPEMTNDELEGLKLQAADALYHFLAPELDDKRGEWLQRALHAFFLKEPCPLLDVDTDYCDEGCCDSYSYCESYEDDDES